MSSLKQRCGIIIVQKRLNKYKAHKEGWVRFRIFGHVAKLDPDITLPFQ